MPFSLIRRIGLLTLVATGLILVLVGGPAWASGPAKPPQLRLHDPWPARPAASLHGRASDMPLRGETAAPRLGCDAPHGALHRWFHGHRRR